MAEKTYDAELETIKGDLADLKKDMQALVKAIGDDQKENGQEAIRQVRDEINRMAGEASTRGKEGISAIEHHIEEKPLASALAAFGIGLLLGKIFGR